MEFERERINSVAIVCGGTIDNIGWLKENLQMYTNIIAADSGYDYCRKSEVIPNVIIGDFDSVLCDLPNNVKHISLPTKKDETDFEACLKYCKNNGLNKVSVFGAWGGRPGHSFAAVFAALKYFKQGIDITFISEKHKMFFVSDECAIPRQGGYVSIFALSDLSAEITLSGFEYPLENCILEPCSPLGVSNKIIGDNGVISVKKGILLIIVENNV